MWIWRPFVVETVVVHFHSLTIKSAFFPIRILVFFFIWSFRAALGAFFDMFWLFEGVSLSFWRSEIKLETVCFSLYSKYRAFHYRLLMMTYKELNGCSHEHVICADLHRSVGELVWITWKLWIFIFLWKFRISVLHKKW